MLFSRMFGSDKVKVKGGRPARLLAPAHLIVPPAAFPQFHIAPTPTTAPTSQPDPATNLAAAPALSKAKSNEEWAKVLTPTQFKVLRRKATEPRKVTVSKGGWDDHFAKGTYVCTGCRTPLYTSEMKFDCGCGWPVRACLHVCVHV